MQVKQKAILIELDIYFSNKFNIIISSLASEACLAWAQKNTTAKHATNHYCEGKATYVVKLCPFFTCKKADGMTLGTSRGRRHKAKKKHM